MGWQFEILDVVNDGKTVDVQVEFMESDEDGKKKQSVRRGYSFREDLCPSKSDLYQMVTRDMLSLSASASRLSDLASCKGATKVKPANTLCPTVEMDVSPTEKLMIDLKGEIKPLAIQYIHKVPECSLDELTRWVCASLGHYPPELISAMIVILVRLYGASAHRAKLVREVTFEALRDFVALQSVEDLILL